MARAKINAIEIEYDIIGQGEPLLLIMGLGRQLVMWPNDFCHELAERGFQVIRFDNRDVGLSTHLNELGTPKVKRELMRAFLGLPVEAPYTLLDMADDAAGLLDALDIVDAHVAGVSMGGMIAQTLTIAHPSRVRSLTSMMAGPGGWSFIFGKPFAMRALLGAPPRDKAEAMALEVAFFQKVSGSRYSVDEELMREQASLAWDRGRNPRGVSRHLAAILATGDRRGALRFVRKPTLVLHGDEDPLVLPSAGRATARAIPGAKLHMIRGLGHHLPRGVWPTIITGIERVAGEADERRRNNPTKFVTRSSPL